jgi:PEP-CTERM motif-containing protein
MRNILKCGTLLATLIFLAVLPARADSGGTLDFDLTGPVSASWTMSENPTTTLVVPGIFTVYVSDFVVDDVSHPIDLYFFSAEQGGGLNSLIELTNLLGAPLYTGTESDPTFLSGVFYLTEGQTGAAQVLTVTQAPEPTTLLMLGSGLAAIALKRKRQTAS